MWWETFKPLRALCSCRHFDMGSKDNPPSAHRVTLSDPPGSSQKWRQVPGLPQVWTRILTPRVGSGGLAWWWGHLLLPSQVKKVERRHFSFTYFYKRKKKKGGRIMIIAPWAQKTIKTPWQHGFFTSLSLSYQLRQHKQLTLLQMLQSNVEAYGGVRKLLSYQLCWPLSQPKVKNEIHPKHIFSNAVVMLPQWHSPVVSAFPSPSPAQSPLLPPPWHKVCLSAAMPQCLGKMGSDPNWSPWRCHHNWHKHNPSTEGPQMGHFGGKEATKAPRDAMGGITWKKILGLLCWILTEALQAAPTVNLAVWGLWSQESFWGPTGWDVPMANTICLICSYQPSGKNMPPPSSKALLNSKSKIFSTVLFLQIILTFGLGDSENNYIW